MTEMKSNHSAHHHDHAQAHASHTPVVSKEVKKDEATLGTIIKNAVSEKPAKKDVVKVLPAPVKKTKVAAKKAAPKKGGKK